MNLSGGQKYKAQVVRIIKKGAIVQLEDDTTELIHLSNISNCFVSDVRQFLRPGDYVEALGIVGKARPVELSLRHLDLKPIYDVPDESNADKQSDSEMKTDDFEHLSFEEMLNRVGCDPSAKYDEDYHKPIPKRRKTKPVKNNRLN